MNSNRGNNRRRGRGSNRQQGGQPTNRIDSRARGNAPQMLEKFKKLAHDAHLNGDRVQEEYYLQFSDHYFRVIADQKRRQDESRQRRDDRQSDQDDSSDDGDNEDYGASRNANGHDRSDNSHDRPDSGDGDRGGGESDDSIYGLEENPFVRDNRAARGSGSGSSGGGASGSGSKPRKPRRRTRDDDADGEDVSGGDQAQGLDPSSLPPAISGSGDEGASKGARSRSEEPQADKRETEKPKPRRRTRKASPPDADGGETLATVS